MVGQPMDLAVRMIQCVCLGCFQTGRVNGTLAMLGDTDVCGGSATGSSNR